MMHYPGLPVVSRTHILRAERGQPFASAVGGLLDDRQKRSNLARRARDFVCRRFSTETVARQFDLICRVTAS